MSPLNNQLDAKRLEVLQDLACWPDHLLAETDAHALGLDVDILATFVSENVKPYLDYFLGYKDVEDCDPQEGKYRWVGCETWSEVLGRYGMLTQYSQVLEVLRITLWTANNPPNWHVSVFLTRKGDWIVWHKLSGYGGALRVVDAGGEQMAVFQTARQMCAYLDTFLTDDYHFAYQYGGKKPEYMPLRIVRALLSCLQSTIEKRKEYLASFESAYAEGAKRLGGVKCEGD